MIVVPEAVKHSGTDRCSLSISWVFEPPRMSTTLLMLAASALVSCS